MTSNTETGEKIASEYTETPGEILRKKREEVGISIDEVSEKLNLQPNLIESLENNNYEIFNVETYLKGYLRAYAKFIGVDGDKVISLYNQQYAEKIKQYRENRANLGFNDPNFKYPQYPNEKSGHDLGESDVNRLARGDGNYIHRILEEKQLVSEEFSEIETAQSGNFSMPYENSTNFTQYPYNHVFESESGHIREIDDSPGAERLFTQHKSGTFEEIHPDGTKVVKVVGSNYEIIAGSSNVIITGDVNLTIEGTKRELVKGDYIQEIEGSHIQRIHKNQQIKVGTGKSGGNREEEIRGNHAYNIKNNVKGYVGEDVDTLIEKNESRTINGYFDGSIVGNYTVTSLADVKISAKTNMALTTVSGIISIKSGNQLNMKSASAMTLKTETSLTTLVSTYWVGTVGTSWTHTSTGITTLNGSQIQLNPD